MNLTTLEQAGASVAVVHLARCVNGHNVLQTFLNSYEEFPSGVEHDLIVVLKGYENDAVAKELAKAALRPYGARVLEISDDGLDLDAYLAAVNAFAYSYYCFLNSFSRVACDDWLGKMTRVACRPNVGIVGATGSYQSILSDELDGIREILARRIRQPFRTPRRTGYDEERPSLGDAGPPASVSGISLPSARPRGLWSSVLHFARRVKWTLQVIWYFPAFPNAHVRTNGFVLSRWIIGRMHWPLLASKIDAYRMESGKRSFTAQVAKMGLEPMLVGKDGRSYSIQEWPASRIFWQGEQENLLLKDNQTLQYELASTDQRSRLYRLAWQDKSKA